MTVKVVFELPDFFSKEDRKAKIFYCDFLRETVATFKAEYYLVGATEEDLRYFVGKKPILIDTPAQLSGEKVMLTANSGSDFVHRRKWAKDTVIIVGKDDGTPTDYQVTKINIPTPTVYPLWSAVAVGIALHRYYSQ